MRSIRFHVATLTLIGSTVASASAQPASSSDVSAARVSARIAYGGHGLDADASIDGPLLADLVRIRAAVGRGRWVDRFGSAPPVGDDPVATRIACSAIFVRPPVVDGNVRFYYGVGAFVSVPGDTALHIQHGVRLTLGLEGFGGGWTVGPEFEADIPLTRHSPPSSHHLLPTTRVGVAIRRRW